MKVVITGHRLHKLESYSCGKIYGLINALLHQLKEKHGYIRGYAGMASGVDLWFCQNCNSLEIPYVACIPFDGQEETMDENARELRGQLIEAASEVYRVKNSWMVEKADMAIVVWDGNKGGTHNVLQQLVENKKPFYWINPVSEVIYDCTKKKT